MLECIVIGSQANSVELVETSAAIVPAELHSNEP